MRRTIRRGRSALGFGNVLKRDGAGARLFAGGDDADLKPAGIPVDLQAAQTRRGPRASVTAISVRRPLGRCRPALLGQVETDRGLGYRLAGLVGDLDGERMRAA